MANYSTSEQAQVQDNNAGYASEGRIMRELIMGFRTTQLIATAAKLDLAVHLKYGPQTAAHLADATKTDQGRLYRLLRALTSIGILETKDPGTFSLSTLGNLLGDVPGSLRNVAMLYGESWLWEAYAQLPHGIENVASPFEYAHGQALYDYLKENPSAAEKFNKAMTAFSDHEAEAVKKAYSFSTGKTIVDVGGGQGFFVLSLLKAHPQLSAVVFDLPPVINTVDNTVPQHRVKYVPGDFFQEVYSGGDIYVLKSVLHNWDNESCLTILKNCHKAMRPATRLLIVERVIPTESEKSESVLFDINMLVMTEGQERTVEEYEALLDAVGFTLNQIISTEAAVSILECFRKS